MQNLPPKQQGAKPQQDKGFNPKDATSKRKREKFVDPHTGRSNKVRTPHGHDILAAGRRFLEKKVFDRVNANSYGQAYERTNCHVKNDIIVPPVPQPVPVGQAQNAPIVALWRRQVDVAFAPDRMGAWSLPTEVEASFEAFKNLRALPCVYVDVGAGGGLERLNVALGKGELGCVVRAASLNPLFHPDDIFRAKKQSAKATLDPRILYTEDGLGTFNRAIRVELPAHIRNGEDNGLRTRTLRFPEGGPNETPAPVGWQRAVDAVAPEAELAAEGELTVAAWLAEETFTAVSVAYHYGNMTVERKEALLKYLSTPVRYFYNFTHSYYYIQEWEKTYFRPRDVIYSQTHTFRGTSGTFPSTGDSFAAPEFQWWRLVNGRIRMRAVKSGGTDYDHPDSTPIYDRGYERACRQGATPRQACRDADWWCEARQADCDTWYQLEQAWAEEDTWPRGGLLTDLAWRPYQCVERPAGHELQRDQTIWPALEAALGDIEPPISIDELLEGYRFPRGFLQAARNAEATAMAANDVDYGEEVAVCFRWASAGYASIEQIAEFGDDWEKREDELMQLYECTVIPAGMMPDDAVPVQAVNEFVAAVEEAQLSAAAAPESLEYQADAMVLRTDVLASLEASMESMQLHAASLVARFHVTSREALEAMNQAHERRARVVDELTAGRAKCLSRLIDYRKNYRYNVGEGKSARLAATLYQADIAFGTRVFSGPATLVQAIGRYRTSGAPRH